MKGLPPKVRVVECGSLPAYDYEALKELIKKAALRKLEQVMEEVHYCEEALSISFSFFFRLQPFRVRSFFRATDLAIGPS